MIKCKIVSMLALLLICQQTLPVAGGVFLYRYNNGDVEFLFTLDPSHSGKMQGFDYPGGTIGPESKNNNLGNETDGFLANKTFNYDDAYTFLRGAIREMLEELVFIPIDLFQKKGQFTPPAANNEAYVTATKKIDKKYEIAAIDFIENKIKTNGIFFIYKKQTTGTQPWEKAAVFFLDITDICPSNLPEEIVKKRIALQNKGFDLRADIDAEPVAFAWVKGTNLLPLLLKGGAQFVKYSQYAEHNKHANAIVTDANTKHSNIVSNNTILISDLCIGMMRDRVNQPPNDQPNETIIKKHNDRYIVFDWNKNVHQLQSQPGIFSSSMRSVIELFQINPNILKPTSAPPPPPAQKFDVQGWIKKHSSKLKPIIKDLLLDNDLINFYTVITHSSLDAITGATTNDEEKIKDLVEKLRLEVVDNKKQATSPQPPVKKIVHPNANQLLTQALELAVLLKTK